ncbi:hypothetical protein AMTRI_Chr03g49330 [Amborella trichopoda]
MHYLYVSSYARAALKKSAGWCERERERERERESSIEEKRLGGARASVHRSSRGNGTLLSCPSPCFLPWQFKSDSRMKPSPLLVAGAIFYADLSLSLALE